MNPQPSTLNPQPVRARAHQRTLPILPAAFRPMSSLDTARRDITAAGFDYTDADLQADIDEGRFEWVWNIAAAGAFRRELRIFTPCLIQHIAWMQNPKTVRRTHSLASVCSALFPTRGAKPFVSTPDLTRAFVCSSELIIDLVCAPPGGPHATIQPFNHSTVPPLSLVPGTTFRRGNGGTALITYASVQNFLQTRRL
jgi:hypothetical protein